jgi:hypothetical protein
LTERTLQSSGNLFVIPNLCVDAKADSL